MADPIEDKYSLRERLEEDRRKMAIQVRELKQDYNVSNRLRASIQRYPWPWLAGSLLTGYLLSRLPERQKSNLLVARSSSANTFKSGIPSASGRKE